MFKRLFSGSKSRSPAADGRASEHLIDLQQVVKAYETPAGPFLALKGVDLQVDSGEFVAVIGKSGSGKSTLINLITGIDRPTHGLVNVAGSPIHQLSEDQVASWRGHNLGVIFQFFQLLPTLTLVENIMLPMEFARLHSPKERRQRALHLLEMVEMVEHAGKLPSAISGGQQQRVAIARSLANDPAVIVADEPTGSLDSRTADNIFKLFESLVAQDKTILMVTHDRDLASRVSRVILISDGEIVDQHVARALQTLNRKQLAEITAKLEPAIYPAGSTIYQQGDAASTFYIIVRGDVEMVRRYPNGREIITSVLDSGQYFGEMELLANTPRTTSVRVAADGDASLLALDRERFTQLMDESFLTNEAIRRLVQERMTVDHVLSKLPDPDSQEFNQLDAARRLTFAPGEVIFQKGDKSEYFYVIVKGEVDIIEPDRGDAQIARLDSGQYFGEIGLIQGASRMATVRAALDKPDGVELVAVDLDTFNRLMAESKLSKSNVARVMYRRLQ